MPNVTRPMKLKADAIIAHSGTPWRNRKPAVTAPRPLATMLAALIPPASAMETSSRSTSKLGSKPLSA